MIVRVSTTGEIQIPILQVTILHSKLPRFAGSPPRKTKLVGYCKRKVGNVKEVRKARISDTLTLHIGLVKLTPFMAMSSLYFVAVKFSGATPSSTHRTTAAITLCWASSARGGLLSRAWPREFAPIPP